LAVRTFQLSEYHPDVNGRLWRLHRELRRRFDIPEAPPWLALHVQRALCNTAFLAAGASYLADTVSHGGPLSAVSDALTLQDGVARVERSTLATFNWIWAAWRRHACLPPVLSGGIEYATPLDAAAARCKAVLAALASAMAPPSADIGGWQEDLLRLHRYSHYPWDTVRAVFNFYLDGGALQPHPRTIITQAQLDLTATSVKEVADRAGASPPLALPGPVSSDGSDGADLAALLPAAQSVAEGIANIVARSGSTGGTSAPAGPPEQWQRPVWDKGWRELWFGGVLCRRYAKRAPEQELILDAFEGCKWPYRVAFPRDWHQRADAVKHLNEGLPPPAGRTASRLALRVERRVGDTVKLCELPRNSVDFRSPLCSTLLESEGWLFQ
jgi:hypothetical protein